MTEIDVVANAFSLDEAGRPLADCTEKWADVFRERAAIAIAALDRHRAEKSRRAEALARLAEVDADLLDEHRAAEKVVVAETLGEWIFFPLKDA